MRRQPDHDRRDHRQPPNPPPPPDPAPTYEVVEKGGRVEDRRKRKGRDRMMRPRRDR